MGSHAAAVTRAGAAGGGGAGPPVPPVYQGPPAHLWQSPPYADLTSDERARVEEGVAAVKAADRHRDLAGDPFAFRPVMGGGAKEMLVLLSEYWLEGVEDEVVEGDAERSAEDLLERDRPGAEAVREAGSGASTGKTVAVHWKEIDDCSQLKAHTRASRERVGRTTMPRPTASGI